MWHIIIIQSPAVKQELFSPKHFRYLHKNEDSMKHVCRNYHKRFSDFEHVTRTLLRVLCTFRLLSIARAQDSFYCGCLLQTTQESFPPPGDKKPECGSIHRIPYVITYYAFRFCTHKVNFLKIQFYFRYYDFVNERPRNYSCILPKSLPLRRSGTAADATVTTPTSHATARVDE